MTPPTPSGTRTREISIPLGRRHASAVSPTGSGRAATWRSPAAISSRRLSESVRRSMKALASPADRARARSERLASSTRAIFSSSPRAICWSASFFARVEASASARAASLAARALPVTWANTSISASSPAREHPQVVPVNDLGEPLVPQSFLDLRRLCSAYLAKISRVVVHESPREIVTLPLGHPHHLPGPELSRDLHQARGEQALALLGEGLS